MGYDYFVLPRATHDQPGGNPHTYFERNTWGSRQLADALIATGTGFDAETWLPIPPFPEIADYGCEWNDDGEPVGDRADEYSDILAKHLAWHGPEVPGIPIHKICTTNDGWHVTREECRSALALYELHLAAGGSHPEAFGDDFIPFLREAARRDGFEVC